MKVACDEVGTHPMQRFVEMINREDEREVIFNAIKSEVVHLAFHPKGNYVLTPILKTLKGQMLEETINPLIEHVEKLAIDSYGICILNQIIELTKNISNIHKIVEQLAANITEII